MHLEKKPRVVFTKAAYRTMFEYCKQSPGEITGFGSVAEHGDTLYVDEIYIMPQEVTGGHCEISGKTMVDFMVWAKKNKRLDLVPKARLWWHSHNNFGVFRSGTDTATCEMLVGGLPYLLCIVANKAGDAEVTLHYPKPRIIIKGIKIEVVSDTDYIAEDVKADVKAKVTEKKFTFSAGNAVAYTNHTDITKLPSRTPANNQLYTDEELANLGKALRKAGDDKKCEFCTRDIPEDRLKVYPGTRWCGNMQCEFTMEEGDKLDPEEIKTL